MIEIGWKNHIVEMKYRMIWVLVGSGMTLFISLKNSHIWLNTIALSWKKRGGVIQYTDPWEGFTSFLIISLTLGLFFIFWILYLQLSAFLKPGLYTEEWKGLKRIYKGLTLGFVVGVFYVWSILQPYSLLWVQDFIVNDSILLPQFISFIKRFYQFIFGFWLISLLPLLWLISLYKPVHSLSNLWDSGWEIRSYQRRWLWLILLLLGSLFTPPDVLSQLGLFLPFVLLIELFWWSFSFLHSLFLHQHQKRNVKQ
jgi:sec-independent protein translocase protein TatC